MMNIRPFDLTDTDRIIALWDLCGLTRPWNNPRLDIQRKLTVNREWFVVGEVGDELIASAMFGYDGHRGWVNYLAIGPEHQRQGHARALMVAGEAWLLAQGCPKLNLQVRRSNISAVDFYTSLGYGEDDVVSLGKRLISDNPQAG
jgi:ribosomal protein S18 acetylase RimI-like enzyme